MAEQSFKIFKMISSGCFTTTDINDYSLLYGFNSTVLMFYVNPAGSTVIIYKYDPLLTGPGDSPKIIKPTNLTNSEAGRWVLQTEGNMIVKIYSGTTDADGNFSVVYPAPLSAVPFLKESLIGEIFNQKASISASTVNGFTVNVKQRNVVTILTIEVLAATFAPVNGATVKVISIQTL